MENVFESPKEATSSFFVFFFIFSLSLALLSLSLFSNKYVHVWKIRRRGKIKRFNVREWLEKGKYRTRKAQAHTQIVYNVHRLALQSSKWDSNFESCSGITFVGSALGTIEHQPQKLQTEEYNRKKDRATVKIGNPKQLSKWESQLLVACFALYFSFVVFICTECKP